MALHKLGEKGPHEEFVARSTAQGDAELRAGNVEEGCGILFQAGLAQGRVGRRREAEEIYLRILKAAGEGGRSEVEEYLVPAVYYNLACLCASDGRKDRALAWLRKAVEAGFRDREWIRADRDLDPLRGEGGYERLLADEELFKRRSGDRPERP